MFKRMIAAVLASLMLLSGGTALMTQIPAAIISAAETDNGFQYEESEDTVTITGYNGSGSDITIPDEINEKPVTVIGNSAFSNCESLTSVTIPESVSTIGAYAFSSCQNLESVTIPQGVTSIADWTFSNSNNLQSVTIPDSVTSIGNYAFNDCGLTEVTLPQSIESIGQETFADCTNLTDVFYAGSVEAWNALDIGDGNDSLTNATIYCSDGEIEGTSEPEPDPNDDFQYSVNEDDTVTITGYNGSDSDITIPGEIDEMPVSIGGSAFYDCSGLTSILISDGVTTIGDDAFSGCSNLTTATIPGSITSIGNGAFNGCSSLTSIAVSDDNSCYSSQDGVLFNKDKTELIQYPIGKTETAYAVPNTVTIIGDQAFLNCKNLENVEIGTGVTKIGKFAFLSCGNLHNITIPETVSEIGAQAFFRSGIRSLTIPGSVKNIPYGLCLLCPDLEELVLKEGVETIENEAFNSCSSLKTVVLPEGLKRIGGLAFNKCISLESVTIPGSIEEFGSMCFISCENLQSVVIKEGVKYIGDFAFAANTNLKTVDIPSSVTEIVTGAFSQCNKLTDVNYAGRRNQWEAITVQPINDCLQNASIHCLSEIQITDKMVSTIASQIYTGKALAPKVTVKDGTKTLTKGTDYTVTYKDNVNAGTASVIIEGIGDYTGSITREFTISKAANKITASNFTKTASASGAQTFTIGAKRLGKAKLTYTSNNSNVTVSTAGKVTIKKNFSGKVTITIKAAATANYKAAARKITVTVKPSKTAVATLKNTAAKTATVTWKKNTTGNGYQIQYSKDKTFKTGCKTSSVAKKTILSKKLTGLTKGKTYYVRMRTVKTVSTTKYYSGWSAAKYVKITK